MKQLFKDNKKNLSLLLKIYLSVVIIILIGMGIWLGKDVVSLFQGVQDFKTYEDIIIQNTNDVELEHAYVRMGVDKITGSYAQYRESDGSETPNQVYYLMPMNDGAYFLTIIANGDFISTLDQMEQTFYDNFGKENKTYQEMTTIEGGFTILNDESKALALEYISAYDEAITDVSQIDQYMSPYAFVINKVGNVSISTIWFCFYVWIGLIILTVLMIALYFSNYWQRYLVKEIQGLPKELKDSLSNDYENATPKSYGKLGKDILYCQNRNGIHIIDLEDLVWVYKREEIIKEHRFYVVYIYKKNGEQKKIFKSELANVIKDLQNDIFTRCPSVLSGYQDFVFELWKKDPSQFYATLKNLDILPAINK